MGKWRSIERSYSDVVVVVVVVEDEFIFSLPADVD